MTGDRTPTSLRTAIASVLWNASNYPPAVGLSMFGQDITPLVDKVVAAVAAVDAEPTRAAKPEPEWEMGSTCGICDEVHALDKGETPEPGRLLYHRQVGPWEQVDQ